MGFILSIMLHRKRLSHVLNKKSLMEVKQSKYLICPYLVLANVLLTLDITLLSLSPVNYTLYESLYQSESSLLADILTIMFAGILFSSMLLFARKQLSLTIMLELLFGFIAGSSFIALLLPINYMLVHHVSEIVSSNTNATIVQLYSQVAIKISLNLNHFVFLEAFTTPVILLVSFIIILYFIHRQPWILLGTILGFSVFIPIVHMFGVIFWLFYAFIVGITFGLFSNFGQRFLFLLFLLVFIVFSFLSSELLIFMFLFGFTLSLMTLLEPKKNVKLLVIIALTIVTLTVAMANQEFSYIILTIAAFGFGEFLIFWLYRDTVRSIFEHWLQLAIQSEGDRIDLSEHESIPDFKKIEIAKDSFFFVYLKYLLLKYLERKGFHIEIVEEKSEQDTLVKSIFITLK